jgi:chromosome segregation ATPase
MPAAEIDRLEAENAELRRRIGLAQEQIDVLRAEALERRAEVRSLAEALPTAMSRHALVTGMLHDVRHHPDKAGVVRRGIRKLGRAPRKAARLLKQRLRPAAP